MITRADIEAALEVVRRFFPPTPLLFAPRLSKRFGAEIWLKLDALTPIRAFKIRGALNKIAALSQAGAKGVATASAGNHGLAVAWAARRFALPCTVVVPEAANPRKVAAIAAEGAEVRHHGADYQAALEESERIANARSLELVHAYDDRWVIAGQGTIALEIDEPGERFLLGIGGGGLISGLGVAFAGHSRPPKIYGVQPAGADSMARSLEAGRVVSLDRVDTCADGLGARRPSELTLELTRRHVAEVRRVSDALLVEALSVLLAEERLVAEPAGAAGLAAILADPTLASEGRVTVLISGANISDPMLERVAQRLDRSVE